MANEYKKWSKEDAQKHLNSCIAYLEYMINLHPSFEEDTKETFQNTNLDLEIRDKLADFQKEAANLAIEISNFKNTIQVLEDEDEK